MNRRDFLRVLAGATTVAGLLVPSTAKIFLPPRGGWPVTRYQSFYEIDWGTITGNEWNFSNRLNPMSGITQADIDTMLEEISKSAKVPMRYLLGYGA